MDTLIHRAVTLDLRKLDPDARTVAAVLSSEYPVNRGGYDEILKHSPDAVDLSRAPLPLIESHDHTQVNIGLVEDLRIDRDKLRGTVRLGTSARASEIWGDIESGIVSGLSVGYQVTEWEDEGTRMIATHWQPYEASLVSVPADPTAGLNRSHRGNDMSEEAAGKPELTLIQNERAWQSRERKRRTEIRTLFQPYLSRGEDYQMLMDGYLDDPSANIEQARTALLAELGSRAEPHGAGPSPADCDYGGLPGHPPVIFGARSFGVDRRNDQFMAGATDAILQRAGFHLDKPHPAAQDFRRQNIADLAAMILEQGGVNCRSLSKDQLISRALTQRSIIGHSTSDFPTLLENIASKALLIGFNEAPATYRRIARVGSLPDFKQAGRGALSDFGDLSVVYENGEYTYDKFTDEGVHMTLQTYGKLFSISRQALINDDLGAFTTIPRGMAAAAVRAIDDQAIAVLTSNPTIKGDTLFSATRGNDVASGSGAAPSVTTLDAGRTAMATMQGPGGAYLNIEPRLLVVPRALQTTAQILATAQNDPAEGGTTSFNAPNPFQGQIEVVADARLDAADPAEWFLLASPNEYDTLEVAFLDGQETPFLDTQDGFTTDGVTYKVRLDFVAAALDWRGMYRNDGN